MTAQAQAEPVSPHPVTVTWTAGAAPVTGYYVYRASPPGGPIVKLTPLPIATNQYVDRTAEPGRTYAYFVTSVDSQKIESKPSETATVKVPAP